MKNKSSYSRGIFILVFYFLFLALDCYFLYHSNFKSRVYSKPILMFFLIFWFHRNTALGMGIPPQSSRILVCTYSILILSALSDFFALCWNIFFWYAWMILYIPIYLVYLFLFIEVGRRAHEEKKLVFYVKKIVPTFIAVLTIAILVLFKAIGLGFELYQLSLYLHAFIICLLAAVCVNMWGFKQLVQSRILFAGSVFFIILTNSTFCFDELYYNRRHPILDVFTALGNGAATILMLLGVIKVLKYWKKMEY